MHYSDSLLIVYHIIKQPQHLNHKPGNETADRLARNSWAIGFVGPEPALGVSNRGLSGKIGRWLVNQHLRQWQETEQYSQCANIHYNNNFHVVNSQRDGTPESDGKTLVLPNDRLGSWYGGLIGALGPNSYPLVGNSPGWLPDFLPGIIPCVGTSSWWGWDSPLCRKCGAEDETSAHILSLWGLGLQ
jgi:hypothetical protein